MYKVVVDFIDLKDNNHKYTVGDMFPRENAKVSDERIAELSSNKNKRGVVLIEEIKEEEPEEEVIEVKHKNKKK